MTEGMNDRQETQKSQQELLADIESAPDSMSLMSAVAAAEGAAFDKLGVFAKGHEAALRLGDRDVAIMYGYRLTAEMNAKAAVDMHAAVGGMDQSTSRMSVAAKDMGAAADLMHRAANTPRY